MSVTDIDPAEAPRAKPRSLWHNRDFLKFWVGETISLLGTQVTILALPLTAIHSLNATDSEVGVLRFVQLAPYLALALLLGIWIDRVRRWRVMLWSNLARMALIALIPLLYLTDLLTVPALLVIACLIGVASVLFDLSWMSYVPTLVKSPKHYVEASSKMGISSSTADVAGPGIAGVVVAWLTAPIALLAQTGTYLLSVVSLMLIRTREPKPEVTTERRASRELKEGLAWVFGKPLLRWLAIIGFCCNFSMITTWTMFLLYGTRTVGLDSTTLGLIFGTASIGGLIGAVVSRRVVGRFPVGPTYFVAQTGLLLGPLLIVLASGPQPVVIGMFIASFFTTYFGLGIANVIIVALRQTLTPQSMMGRMTACFRTLLFGGGALGGLCAGLLADAIGARNALVVAAVGSAAVVVGLVLSPVSRLRKMPEAVTETPPTA
ncbi:MFS transporter [Actinoalloteichus caeruleus]|uniref:Arabinose efflux permease, MFS family n=1 Tax=Actinoalloteichus caeruleus DSM 43889 TaxID=1120930 RepID=A0ABT1JEI7_ACTCY|nr:MFS transporter [Actinoalloteichus caeruleus]MCP2330556.1 putative arabinose efflux permease, MFS family [Actinoalloteichus caeruleus DSM 43889]